MPSDREFVSKKGRLIYERSSRKYRNNKSSLWRHETPKRSVSRSITPATKKIKKVKKPLIIQYARNKKNLRREFESQKENQPFLLEQPKSPHNTTQYIIGANHSFMEVQNNYQPNDQFQFDFQHHAMAGTMMNLMKNRLTQIQEQFTSPTTVGSCDEVSMTLQEGSIQESQMEIEQQEFQFSQSILAKDIWENEGSVENGFVSNFRGEDEKENNPNSSNQVQAEENENLKGYVKHLVKVLEQKDQEIAHLKHQLRLQIISHEENR